MTDSPRARRRAMLDAYAELITWDAEKKRLLPPLLVDLVPNQAWIDCVAASNAAHSAFVAAAKAYCLSLTDTEPLRESTNTP